MSNIILLYDAEKLDRVKITLQFWIESIFLVKTLRVKNSYVGKIDDYSVNNAATQKILPNGRAVKNQLCECVIK